ncbi:MAG TPA: DivIVA domain-containing protein [Vicinamibacteria bacterium]|nr:DivIVA domain-containing protein [Vicinamibacteria bacterium]
MKLTPLDIQRHEFQQRAFRGLDGAEVRMFLNAVSEEMEHLRADNERMSEEVRRLTALLSEHHQREEILKNTLVAAQRTSEELKENAKKQSQMLLKEAELAADRLVEAAQSRAHEIEKDIMELKMQKRQVLNSILAAIANLRNLIQLMSETEAEREKLSFLKRRADGGGSKSPS